MGSISAAFTVLFDDPFWIGLYERMENGRYEVCKVTFGAEPKDYDVYAFLLENWHRLSFSPPIRNKHANSKRQSPKRIQRAVQKQVQPGMPGTKAQQALKLQHEQAKQVRQVQSREQREEEKAFQFACRQKKRKAKHRGH